MVFNRAVVTSIEIAALPERVWEVIADFPAYPSWNPFLTSIEGELKEGGRLSIFAKPPGQKGMKFKPLLLKVQPGKELRWRGSLPVPGLFTGEHYFVLEAQPGGATKLTHGEDFSGLLLPLAGGALKATDQGFTELNQALKARVEGK